MEAKTSMEAAAGSEAAALTSVPAKLLSSATVGTSVLAAAAPTL